MKLRKWLVILIACLALCSVSACGGNENPPAETKGNAGVEETGEESGTEEAEEESGPGKPELRKQKRKVEPGKPELRKQRRKAEPGKPERKRQNWKAELQNWWASRQIIPNRRTG